MIDVYKGKYFTAEDATKDIDIVTITKECENLTDVAEDLHEMNSKTSQLFGLCNKDALRVYQNNMEEAIDTYRMKLDETADETRILADRVLATATKIYVNKQEAYNKAAQKKEDKKLKEIAEEKARKAAKKNKQNDEGYGYGSLGDISPSYGGKEAASKNEESIDSVHDALTEVEETITKEVENKEQSYYTTGELASTTTGGDDQIIFDEERVEDAQNLLDSISGDLADIDDRLYSTLRKLSSATGFELIEETNSDVDLHLPEKLMMENRNDARNMGNTLTNITSLFNIINTGKTTATSAPQKEEENHYIVTSAPTTAAPQPTTVAATVAPAQPATTPGTVAPPTVANTVQAKELDGTASTLSGNSGTLTGSTSAPTSTVMPASPISFDSSIPDTTSNSKVLGAYAIPAAAGIAAGVGGLGIAHRIKRDKEDEALFGADAIEQEFAEEFKNQVQEAPPEEEKKEEDNEPIRDEKGIYNFFK